MGYDPEMNWSNMEFRSLFSLFVYSMYLEDE